MDTLSIELVPSPTEDRALGVGKMLLSHNKLRARQYAHERPGSGMSHFRRRSLQSDENFRYTDMEMDQRTGRLYRPLPVSFLTAHETTASFTQTSMIFEKLRIIYSHRGGIETPPPMNVIQNRLRHGVSPALPPHLRPASLHNGLI